MWMSAATACRFDFHFILGSDLVLAVTYLVQQECSSSGSAW